MDEQLKEKIDKVSRIGLKEILQDFGAVFVKDRQFYHPYWGIEKTPSGFIYTDKNGKERWKHFKQGIGGDGIEFVKQVTGAKNIYDALDKILGPDKTFKVKSEAEMKAYNEHLMEINVLFLSSFIHLSLLDNCITGSNKPKLTSLLVVALDIA